MASVNQAAASDAVRGLYKLVQVNVRLDHSSPVVGQTQCTSWSGTPRLPTPVLLFFLCGSQFACPASGNEPMAAATWEAAPTSSRHIFRYSWAASVLEAIMNTAAVMWNGSNGNTATSPRVHSKHEANTRKQKKTFIVSILFGAPMTSRSVYRRAGRRQAGKLRHEYTTVMK